MVRASIASVRACQDRDGNECADENKVEEDPQPAERLGASTSEEEGQNHRNEGVKHSSCKYSFNCTIGMVDSVTSFDCVYETVHLVHSLGEDTERDHGGKELEDAHKAEEPGVE